MVITFFYTIGLFSFAVTFHALLLRILGQNQFMLWGLIYGFAILALINTLPVPELSYPFFSLNFILLWLMYLYFLGSLTRSISIHMISQIVEHGPSKFDREDILELYHEDQSSLVRFEAMAKNLK